MEISCNSGTFLHPSRRLAILGTLYHIKPTESPHPILTIYLLTQALILGSELSKETVVMAIRLLKDVPHTKPLLGNRE